MTEMLKLTEVAVPEAQADDELTLSYEHRQKSRLPAQTDGGVKVGFFLPRGQRLHSGVILTGADHYKVLIKAASEQVSVVRSDDALLFARTCYHLGQGLGLVVTHEVLPFEPEAGAYHSHD